MRAEPTDATSEVAFLALHLHTRLGPLAVRACPFAWIRLSAWSPPRRAAARALLACRARPRVNPDPTRCLSMQTRQPRLSVRVPKMATKEEPARGSDRPGTSQNAGHITGLL